MGDARGRVDPLAVYLEAAIRPAVARGEKGRVFAKARLYRDKDGKTISQDFVEKLDPPNIGFKVTDIPGTLSKDGGIKGMGGML